MINGDIALHIQNIALNLLTLQSTGGHTNWIATNFIVLIAMQRLSHIPSVLVNTQLLPGWWHWAVYIVKLLNIGNFINVKDLSTLSLLQRSIDCEERGKPCFPSFVFPVFILTDCWKVKRDPSKSEKKVKVKLFNFWNDKSSPSAQSPCWCPAAPCHRFLGQVSCIIQTWNETWKQAKLKMGN